MARKKALITGITGQVGSYLAEYLLHLGYQVHGLIRRSSTFNTGRIQHIRGGGNGTGPHFNLHYGDLTDGGSVTHLVYELSPDEIYHLGAQTHVRVSFDAPVYTAEATGLSNLLLLEAVRRLGSKTRLFQASTSEMFGSSPPPQNEKTSFHPRSPYAAAKLFAYWNTVNYREAYGLNLWNGILFNHESPRRGDSFVTRKITKSLAMIASGMMETLWLGNLDARRDWGFAPEYVTAMHAMLQQDHPRDYVIGTGVERSVREFIDEACAYIGLEIEWRGEGVEETGQVRSVGSEHAGVIRPGQVLVRIDPYFFRPTEVESLLADAGKARRDLGWNPRVTFSELVRVMMDFDFQNLGLTSPDEGRKDLNGKGFDWTSHEYADPYLAPDHDMSAHWGVRAGSTVHRPPMGQVSAGVEESLFNA
ncbi:MAG: GDP-mannose 4,6-dehydratase [Proteobacteria bacterium]|nr:GDP-mannose 4,6-dehydratase [Pseudomonadota bacterium]